MPYIRYPSFKTGVNPCIRNQIDMNYLTGTQKLMLANTRIFGTTIPANMRNGNRVLKAPLKGAKRLSIFEVPIWNHRYWFPYFRDHDIIKFREEVAEGRKLRILMRGVKIGKKKGGSGFALMNIFEKKADKPADKK